MIASESREVKTMEKTEEWEAEAREALRKLDAYRERGLEAVYGPGLEDALRSALSGMDAARAEVTRLQKAESARDDQVVAIVAGSIMAAERDIATHERDVVQRKLAKLIGSVVAAEKKLYNGHDAMNPRCGLEDTLSSSCNCAETRVAHVSGLLRRAIEETEQA
jgi:hypothetical protein